MFILKAEGISKKFRLYNSPSDRLKELLFKKKYHTELWALKDVSFELKPAEVIGIIGKNGSGKSTLLKIITGIILPDSGKIHINGRVAGLLELGTGFNYEFSGRENIYLNASFFGFSRNEIKNMEKRIIEFSELGEFIDKPLKTYSSGMVMRLGFSIAININPDCLLVDEALSVGDIYFQQKCFQKIKELKENGRSILFVSHDLNAIKLLSDRVILLDRGRIVYSGDPEEAVNFYNELLSEKDLKKENGYGNKKALIKSVRILDKYGKKTDIISCGDALRIELEITAKEDISDLTAGFLFRNRFGLDIFGTNTYLLKKKLSIKKGERKKIRFFIPEFNLSAGTYSLTVALHRGKAHFTECYHWIDKAGKIRVIQKDEFTGVCRLNVEVED